MGTGAGEGVNEDESGDAGGVGDAEPLANPLPLLLLLPLRPIAKADPDPPASVWWYIGAEPEKLVESEPAPELGSLQLLLMLLLLLLGGAASPVCRRKRLRRLILLLSLRVAVVAEQPPLPLDAADEDAIEGLLPFTFTVVLTLVVAAMGLLTLLFVTPPTPVGASSPAERGLLLRLDVLLPNRVAGSSKVWGRDGRLCWYSASTSPASAESKV